MIPFFNVDDLARFGRDNVDGPFCYIAVVTTQHPARFGRSCTHTLHYTECLVNEAGHIDFNTILVKHISDARYRRILERLDPRD